MLDQAHMEILGSYRGREQELLSQLERQIHGTIQRSPSLNHQEVADNAFYEASSNIRNRIHAAGQRGQSGR